MEELRISLTEAWAYGAGEASAVPIPSLGGTFLLTPFDDRDMEELAAAHGYCPHCQGRGYLPVPFGREMRKVECGKCKGKTVTLDARPIRRAALKKFCQGWEGWTFASGAILPDNDRIREAIVSDDVVYTALRVAAHDLKKRYREEEGKNSESGPPISSAAVHGQQAPPPASDEP